MLMREKEFLVNKFYSMYLKRNKTAFNVYRKKKFTFAIAIAILYILTKFILLLYWLTLTYTVCNTSS